MSHKKAPLLTEDSPTTIETSWLPDYDESIRAGSLSENRSNSPAVFMARSRKYRWIQIILGLFALFLVQRRSPQENGVEVTFIFITLHFWLLSLVTLLDKAINGEFRKLLQLQIELYYIGAAALFMYVGSFWMVVTFFGNGDYYSLYNTGSGFVGMGVAMTYALHWNMLYQRKQMQLHTEQQGKMEI